MKKHFFKIVVGFIIIALAGSCLYLYIELRESETLLFSLEEALKKKEQSPKEKMDFNKDYVRNSKVDVYCPLSLEKGKGQAEDLSQHCMNLNLPSRSLEVELMSVKLLNDSQAVGVIKSQLEELPDNFELAAFNKKRGHFASLSLDEEPTDLKIKDELIHVQFEDEETTFRLIGDQFEEVVSETRKLTSPDHGITIEIPKTWQAEHRKDGLTFFNPASKYVHFINVRLKNGEYVFDWSENNPYQEELQKMQTSLDVNQLGQLPDYQFLEEDLNDYLKVDTTQGTIQYFKENELEKKINILASGEPTSWRGTPSGLYEILSKEGLRFSTESGVYMPNSMRLYGKYLIHGEAYFPSGAPYESPVSGGCVRVKNSPMEELYDLVEPGLSVLSITHQMDAFPATETKRPPLPEMTADSFLVADIDAGKVFADQKPNKQRPIASITKLMTAITVSEHIGFDTKITVKDYMLDKKGSTPGLTEGRQFRMIDLLAPLLIDSSNDAAKILSHFLGRESTLKQMNEKADAIGMDNTEFVETSGLDEGNVSTAKDLYYLIYYLVHTRQPILDITREESVSALNYNVFPNLENQITFYDNEDFLGGKTGYIPPAGHTGAFLFELELGEYSRRVVFILLNSDSRKDLEDEVFRLKNWIEKAYN